MKKIITYVMIFTMLITTAAVSMAVPASAAVKKQSKRQVTLIRSYNKIYRKCKNSSCNSSDDTKCFLFHSKICGSCLTKSLI